MISIRKASFIAVVAFGLMGCATQGIASPSAPLMADASSSYQPSPNARPLAVQPPSTVTGAVGNRGIETASGVASNVSYQPSPNARPVAVQPPPTVTGAVGSGETRTSLACVDQEEGATGTSPNARLCP
ncbi:MAG TPA: hypothetical protein VNO21_25275 [Polyangiaceae bacterium]|nr:hypothetical protein [Polyangiaceae bacterium]